MNEDKLMLESLYEDIYNEAQRGHGRMNDVEDLLKQGLEEGLYRVEPTKNGYKLLSNYSRDIETIDKGERAFHYLRRFINKIQTLKQYSKK